MKTAKDYAQESRERAKEGKSYAKMSMTQLRLENQELLRRNRELANVLFDTQTKMRDMERVYEQRERGLRHEIVETGKLLDAHIARYRALVEDIEGFINTYKKG